MVDCRKFLDSNALGLTFAALSSYDPEMRAAAYSILAAYYSHLEGARFREQPQVGGAEGAWEGPRGWLSTHLPGSLDLSGVLSSLQRVTLEAASGL